MPKIIITIDTSNAAFQDSPGHEVAWILKTIAGKYAHHEANVLIAFPISDSNGNIIGQVKNADLEINF